MTPQSPHTLFSTGSLLTLSATALSQQRNPLSRITRLDGARLHTPANRVYAHSKFDITFTLDDTDQEVRLVLEPNHDILPDNAQINILASDGTSKSVAPVERSKHKVFKGGAFIKLEDSSEWANAGWARIVISRDGTHPLFEGVFRIAHDHHHIMTSSHYHQTKHRDDPGIEASDKEYMVVWRDSDIMENLPGAGELKRDLSGHSCMSDDTEFNTDLDHPVYQAISTPTELELTSTTPWWAMTAATIFRRQDFRGGNANVDSLISTIGSTVGCPTTRKVALIGIATDCTYAQELGSQEEVQNNVISIVNSASALYESTFGISLAIQNLTITDDSCPAAVNDAAPWNLDCPSANIQTRLNLFSEWRGRFRDSNAYWTLMSTCATNSAVGLAWLGQLCSQGSAQSSQDEIIAGANVVIRTEGGRSEWQVFAHEAGHTFGAVHDCTETTCSRGDSSLQRCCPLSSSTCDADGRFIMNPSTGVGIQAFSQCTVGNICTAMLRQSVKTGCLTDNRNVQTITGQVCGNGIVEAGEECDCGGEDGCAGNPCCDANTCQFTQGSVCDPNNEQCCTRNCQLAAQGFVCRPSTGLCDPEEVCTGESPTCPEDSISDDGVDCGGGLQCASGQCTSRDQQCRSVLGAPLNSSGTYACSDGCAMVCHSDTLLPSAMDCYSLMQNFLDGTPCDGGMCENGICRGGGAIDGIGRFVSDNSDVIIPVVSVVGGLIVVIIVACSIASWRRRRHARRAPKPQTRSTQNSWTSYGGAWRGPTTPHHSMPWGGTTRSASNRSRPGRIRSHADDQNDDQETREPMLPRPDPPPQYTAHNVGHNTEYSNSYGYGGGSYPGLTRGQSVRYA